MFSSRILIGLVGLIAAAQLAIAAASPLTIVQPIAGSTVKGTITVEVAVDAGVGITNLDVKLDGANIAAGLKTPPFTASLDTRPLLSGPHTLLAVARNSAGAVIRSEVISFNTTNPPQYSFSPGPYTIENLGSLIQANTQEQQWMFRLPSNNDLHLLLYYDLKDPNLHPIQILDVNLTTGTARLTNAATGRPGPYATVLYTNNNKIYVGSYGLVEYDPATGASRQISFFRTNATGSISSASYMDVGGDGFIYIGKCYSEGLERYNPMTRVYEDLGSMDPEKPPGVTYDYTVGADSRYVYVGLGQLPWYLAVYDNQTRTRSLFWKTNNDLLGLVRHAKSGGLYYQRKLADNSLKWYKLANGLPVEIAAAEVPLCYSYSEEKVGIVKNSANFPIHYSTEINLDAAYPDNSANRAMVKWRTVGSTNWQSASAGGFFLEPINIMRLYAHDATQLFGFADFYGPAFLYDVDARESITLGRPQYSLYDAIFETGKAYLAGYPAATLDYTRTKQWTLTGSTPNPSDINVNPKKTSLVLGKYHYYSAFGADGFVYAASQHIRDSTGGELGWWDPLTGAKGSLREPFLDSDVRDLKSVLGGTKLVYSSDAGKVFVIDTSTKQIERVITPIPGLADLDKVVEVSPGMIFGAVSNRIFKVDIRDGTVLYANTLPGLAFGGTALPVYDHRIVLGPDGLVWMFVGNSLYRIDPTDGALMKILDTPAKTPMLMGGDLYLYGGPNLYRVRNILNSTRPGAAGPLDLTPVGL